MTDNNYCVILAGGNGSRLWPVSRSTRPKQFLDLFGTGRTMLQQTYDRISRFIKPENIYISTNVQYLQLIYEQLPQVDDEHILEEPLRRGSLASVAWASVVISKKDADARLLISPADQIILDQECFEQEILHGMNFAGEKRALLVLGVRPTRADIGYGYIQKHDEIVEKGIYKVQTFTEKPEKEFAEIFLQDDSFLWNVGIHIARPDVILDTMFQMFPEYTVQIPHMMAEAENADPKLVPEFFQMLPNLSLDTGILERTGIIFVQECHFRWADIGTWSSIYDDVPADDNGNILMDTRAFMYDCKNNIVRLPKGRTAVIKGLTDYVIVEEGDILMICPREDVAAMRKMHTDTKFR